MAIGDARGPEAAGLPHFIMVGAPKCGTTSMHAMLASHPDVFIPENEVFFFDVDDVMAHPDFFVHRDGLSFHDYEGQFDDYLAWYRSLFKDAKPGQVIGEDTTTYLSSRDAPDRIAALLPDARLIALLRDPVDRAYSQYLHNVRAGRATLSFERTLRTNPGALLEHGFYEEHLRRYQGFLQAGQMTVVFFEDLVREPLVELANVCGFVGLEGPPPVEDNAKHSNAARPPLHFGSRLLLNHYLGHRFSFPRPRPNLPNYRGPDADDAQRRTLRWYEKAVLSLDENMPRRRPPRMRDDTRAHLQRVFGKRNAGLAKLLDTDVHARWPYMPA